MAKITSASSLNVGTELTLDTAAKTFTLNVAGNLVAKDGVSLQSLYSKFITLWETAAYNKYPFPMYAIDALSGQFQFGTDGATYNGWKPANDTTRSYLRDGGWSEYSAVGVLQRQYVGIVALASGFPAGAQFYYQRTNGGVSGNFTYTDAPNEGIQVFGDATNGNFDNRTYFKIFCREPNYTFDDAVLGDVGLSATGPFKVSLPIAVGTDLKTYSSGSPILDTAMSGAPYNLLTLTWYGSNQNKTIGASPYPFRIIVDNSAANATLEQIYTWVQYKLRQATDIDAGAGTVTGKIADSLMYFVGDTLYTTQSVFVNGVIPADLNRIYFVDQNGVQRSYPYAAAGSMSANALLQNGGTGYYRMYFANDDAGDNTGRDYGSVNAITVNDKDGIPIQGSITGGTINFSYDYDGNVQRGNASAGIDAPIVVVAGNRGQAKPVVAVGTITKSKSISISLVAEQDRVYA